MSNIPPRRSPIAAGKLALLLVAPPLLLLAASGWAMHAFERDATTWLTFAREHHADALAPVAAARDSAERTLGTLRLLQLAALGIALVSSGALVVAARSFNRLNAERVRSVRPSAARPSAIPGWEDDDPARSSSSSFSTAVRKIRKFFETDEQAIAARLRAVTSMNTTMAGGATASDGRVPGVIGSIPPSGSFPTDPPPSRHSLSPSGVTERQVKRVLLVDDDAEVLRAFARVLRAQRYEVTSAASARQAMNELRSGDFDVIVSDITMPEMDGIQLLREVRSRDLLVPVVLVTGAPAVGTAAQAVELGAFQYLVKPVDKDSLRKVVDHATRVHDVARARQQAAEMLGQEGVLGTDRAGLEASFGRTLEGLWVAYQPIVDVRRQRVFGYEALLRSNEPSLPHPGAVLDAAERLGRLDVLGRAVRSRAALPMMSEPEGSLLFVNLHVRDLLDPTLSHPDMPLSKIAKRVVLEITERSSLEEVRDARGRAAALREMGFRIAVDDMGAGYAGLSSFALLEPEIVKLDMSLIRDVHVTPTKQKVIRSMTSLANDMGIQIIGEGVETSDERDMLVALGCDLHQGYLFARPGKPFPSVAWPAEAARAYG